MKKVSTFHTSKSQGGSCNKQRRLTMKRINNANAWTFTPFKDRVASLLLPWLQVLLTLSHKCFSHFSRPTCSLSVSCRYLGLREIHLASSNNMLKLFYSWNKHRPFRSNLSMELRKYETITRLWWAFSGFSFILLRRRINICLHTIHTLHPTATARRADLFITKRFAKWFRDSHYGLFNRLY